MSSASDPNARARTPPISGGHRSFCARIGRWWPISIVCAIFVSAAATGGLGTLLPIMRVLIKGDTIGTWADREIAQRRLGVKFADDVNAGSRDHQRRPGSAAAAGRPAQYDQLTSPVARAQGQAGRRGAASRSGRSGMSRPRRSSSIMKQMLR